MSTNSREIQSLALEILPLIKDGSEAALLISITVLSMKIDFIIEGALTLVQHRRLVDEQYARLVATAATSKEYFAAYSAAHASVTSSAAATITPSFAVTTSTTSVAAAVCPLLFKKCLALHARETVMDAALSEALDELATSGPQLRQYSTIVIASQSPSPPPSTPELLANPVRVR
jgi:hypothetical protein